MLNFKLEIQESERLITKGILCIIRSDGKKIYCRLAKNGNEISLVPLSKDEMVKAEIQESDQTINNEFWDIQVEESEKTPIEEQTDRAYEEAKKKTFNLGNLEEVKRAETIAKNAREVLEGKNPYDKQVADNVRKTISDKYIALGHSPPTLETKEDIEGAIEILKSLEDKQRQITRLEDQIPTPSGSAPLNDRQIYGQIPEQSFNSEKEMVDYLRKNPSAENEAILKKLFEKTVQGIVDRKSWELPFENANPKSKSESDSNVEAVEVSIHSIKEGESEVEKWTKKKKRKMIVSE